MTPIQLQTLSAHLDPDDLEGRPSLTMRRDVGTGHITIFVHRTPVVRIWSNGNQPHQYQSLLGEPVEGILEFALTAVEARLERVRKYLRNA